MNSLLRTLDVGECLMGIHNCSQGCIERMGGFECECDDGYNLEDNGVSCEGINSVICNNYKALLPVLCKK